MNCKKNVVLLDTVGEKYVVNFLGYILGYFWARNLPRCCVLTIENMDENRNQIRTHTTAVIKINCTRDCNFEIICLQTVKLLQLWPCRVIADCSYALQPHGPDTTISFCI
jgi:hypothetical protein